MLKFKQALTYQARKVIVHSFLRRPFCYTVFQLWDLIFRKQAEFILCAFDYICQFHLRCLKIVCYFVIRLFDTRSSRTSTFRMSAIWYNTGMGGCTLICGLQINLVESFSKSVFLFRLADVLSLQYLFNSVYIYILCPMVTKVQNLFGMLSGS